MKETAYLFVHFTGETPDGEQIYFSLSRDGLHWQDLNHGEPVLRSSVGEKGVRDPFILRMDDTYVIIATDLRIANGKGWGIAQYEGSRNLLVWKTTDLTNWGNPELVEVGVPTAGCVWAPEAIFDEETKEYMVFWASMVQAPWDKEPKQKIYSALTLDFSDFHDIRIYIEKENHVIDTTMIYENESYYRYSKDETTKNIRCDRGGSLWGSFKNIPSETVDNLYGVEGPIIFKFIDRDEWCLLVDQFATGGGYLPIVTKNLDSGEFRILEPSEYDMGQTKKRHGSVLKITEDEYQALLKKYSI